VSEADFLVQDEIMADFALVLFDDGIKAASPDGNSHSFIKRLSGCFSGLLYRVGLYKSRLGSKIYYFFKKEVFRNGINKVELFGSIGVWLIRLPFPAAGLGRFNPYFIGRYLDKVCSERGIGDCHMPAFICEKTGFDRFSSVLPVGRMSFKSLLPLILEKIFTNSGLNIADLDIVIVPGEDNNELYTVVKILEPGIRYVTIASKDKEAFEKGLSGISEESGLSIGVSGDCKSMFKCADLIINLGNGVLISKCRICPKSVIINFNEPCRLKIQGDNTVINGVEYELPSGIREALGYDVSKLYSRKEAADLIIAHKLGIRKECRFNSEVGSLIRNEFGRCGCKITGFTGLRGAVKMGDLPGSVKRQGLNGNRQIK